MADRLRRTFIHWALGLSAGSLVAAIAYPIAKFLTPPEIPEPQTAEVDAGAVTDPDFVEKRFKIIRFGPEPVIVIRVSDADYRAFSAVCTHLACIVDFPKEKNLIWCWCHDGIYDLTGKNIGGPPSRPLAPYAVALATSDGGTQRVIVRKV